MSPDPLAVRAEILVDGARFGEAVRDIEGGLDRLPSDPRWRDRAISLLIQCGAGDKAIQAARGGVAADPGAVRKRILANCSLPRTT